MSNAPERLPSIPASRRFLVGAVEVAGRLTVQSGAVERETGRKVVLQRLAEVCAQDAAARSGFEAGLLAALRLRHEHLARIHSAARDSEGAYCVLDLPAVPILSARLAQGGLRGADVLRIARAVGAALACCHRQGLTHGNVHPSSVQLDDLERVRLTGFGLLCARRALARPVDDPQEEPSEEAVAQSYRLPEAGPVDGVELDLFDFGRLLYHLATGEPPETISMGLLPAWLHEVVRRTLDPGGEEGFRSIDDLLAALEQGVAGLSPAATPEERPPEFFDDPTAPIAVPGPGRTTEGGGPNEPAGSLLSPPPLSPSPPFSPFPWMRAENLYRTVGRAGKGGMGSVEEAIEIATGRRVAIKRLLRTACAGSAAGERFHREAQHVARLSHRNILALIQPARDERGDYLVLEWAPGGSLQQRIKEHGPFALAELIELARRIGSALAYAHEHGMIHRDVKPHNILYSGAGEPKLADFGLARFVEDQTLSSSRVGAGTPLYMAPEQRVDSTDVDARTDLYAFGKTLYFAATGGDPTVVDISRMPRLFRALVTACLSELPHNRPPKMAAFLEQLERSVRSRRRRPLVPALLIAGSALLYGLFRDDSLPAPTLAAPVEAAQPEAEPPARAPSEVAPAPEVEVPAVPLELGIEAPVEGTVTREGTISLRVRISSGEPEQVVCGGVELTRRGDRFVAEAIPLEQEGENLLAIVARSRDGQRAEVCVRVLKDTEGPRLMAADPENGRHDLEESPFEVRLRFDEPVSFVSLARRTLTVDSERPDEAQGRVLLAPGLIDLADQLQWTARDRAGNQASGFLDYALAGPRVPEAFRALGDERGAEGWARRVEHLGAGIELVLIEPGSFLMGSPEGRGQDAEHPRHEVVIDRPFYLGATEVTVLQWRRFVQETGYLSDAERGKALARTLVRGAEQSEWLESDGANWEHPFPDELLRSLDAGRFDDLGARSENHPVTLVTWNDARMFCEHFGLELPSEAMWEYASRNAQTVGRTYWWGDAAADADGKGNFLDRDHPLVGEPDEMSPFTDRYALTAPAGTFAPSPLGLFDLAGNVSEWTSSPAEPYPGSSWKTKAPILPGGRFQIVRGTSWTDPSFESAPATRTYRDFRVARPFIGFRVAKRL